jgi:heptaprenyl diphosphate synthase
LCGASEAEIQALYDYGYYLGMGFQVVDDILDFKGDEDQIGKPVANDLRQGIATLPVMLFNQDRPDHPTILKAVRRQKPSDDEILAVVEEIRASGCVEASMEAAVTYIRQAQAALTALPDNAYYQAMKGIADYAVTRDI